MQCFQKDPNLRVSARKLLKHPWIMNSRRPGSIVRESSTKYDEAVKSVQQWNEALKMPRDTPEEFSRAPTSSTNGTSSHGQDTPGFHQSFSFENAVPLFDL